MKFDSKKITTHIIWLFATIALIVYFLPQKKDQTLSFEENRPWDHRELIAPFEIYIYPDTANVTDSLQNAFIPIAKYDNKIFDSIAAVLSNNNYYIAQKILPKIQNQYEIGVIDAESYSLIENGKLPSLRMLDGKVLNKIETSHFVSPRRLYLMIDSLIQDTTSRNALKEMNIQQLLVPNIIIDKEKSELAYEEDLARATAPIGVIMQNERIIDRGQKVTPELYRILNTYTEMLAQQAPDSQRTKWMHLLGQTSFVLILIVVLYLYLHTFCSNIIYTKGNLLFILLMISSFSIVASIASSLFSNGIYLVPFAIIPIVILVFFDPRTAIFCHIIEILICASFAPFPLLSIIHLFFFCHSPPYTPT